MLSPKQLLLDFQEKRIGIKELKERAIKLIEERKNNTRGNRINELQTVFAKSFEAFLVYFYDKVENPQRAKTRKQFVVKDFHKEIITHLQKIVLDENYKNSNSVNTIINIPPRHGKSTIMDYWVVWGYTINPYCNFIYTSYSQSLAHKMSQTIKDIMGCEEFKELYPEITFHKKKDAKGIWSLKNGGEFVATALGGQITGFGAGNIGNEFGGAIIIDDPLKPDDAKYPKKRQNALDYYTDTLKSRKNSPSTPIVLIMQRLHTEDLTGHLLENEKKDWTHFKFKAVNEEKNTAIWEEVKSFRELAEIKISEPKIYYGQYQQEPIIEGGNLIKQNWFRYFNYEDTLKLRLNKVFIVGDTAFKTKEHNDYTVFTLFASDGVNLYVLDMIRGKWEATPMEAELTKLWDKWKNINIGFMSVKCQGIYIEDKGSGTGLIQTLKSKGMPIRDVERSNMYSKDKRSKDKLTRFYEMELYFSSGRIYLPNWDLRIKQEIITECIRFTADMSHKHDDIVDTLIDGALIGLAKASNTLVSMYGK